MAAEFCDLCKGKHEDIVPMAIVRATVLVDDFGVKVKNKSGKFKIEQTVMRTQRIENDKTAYRPWALAIKKAGIRHRKPYNTRHTFATLNLMAGANPMWVARQLGHTTMKMLLENYSRWIDSADKQREKSKLEDFLNCANDVPKNQKNTASI